MARPRNRVTHSPSRPTGAHALPTRDAEGRPLLRLQTLGAATILVGESRLSASAGTQFALLLRVASAPGMLVNRDVLLGSLWPNQPIVRQRANLRQSLYKLRSNDVRIEMQGDVVQLDASQVVRAFSLDRTVEYFERDFTHGVEPFGVFLPGFEVPWPEMQDWVVAHRESVHAEVRRVLVGQLKKRRERADWGGADVLARWLLQFDPLNEEATLTIAECTALTGSKTEALAIIDRYLEELGPDAGDLRLQANTVRRRISDMGSRTRTLVSPTERYFVGREREMADLTMSMRRARWHDGSAVLVHGPAGIGKSRLARELEKVAAIEGFRIVRTSCRETELTRPMSIFLDLLPDIVSLPGALGCAPESLESLKRLLPKDYLNRLQRAPMPAADPDSPAADQDDLDAVDRDMVAPNAADVNATPSSLRRAILDVICAVAEERPLLVIIEDVHWIDEQSWDALTDLLDRIDAMRVFVVLNSRERHARPTPPERAPMRLRPMPLASLSLEKSQELSNMVAEDLAASLTSDLGEWFARASEGVPLFVHSLVVHWVDTGEAGGVPPTLQGVIEQRLARLDGTAIRVLQTSALLGRWATAERVQRVLELRTNEMLGAITQIEGLGAVSIQPGGILRPHELVSWVCTEQMTRLSERSIRMRIAAALSADAIAAKNPDQLLASVEQLSVAEAPSEIAHLLRSNQTLLAEISVPAEAIRLLQSVSALPTQQEVSAEILAAIARLHVAAGRYDEAFVEPISRVYQQRAILRWTDQEANEALTLADVALRVDHLIDRRRTIDLLVEVAQNRGISRTTRIRAVDIGLSAISNDGTGARAKQFFVAIREFASANFDDPELQRALIMYHAIFGEQDAAVDLAFALLSRAKQSRPSPSSHRDALRSAVALRLAHKGEEHLEAFELAHSLALGAQLAPSALNAAFHLSHALLDIDERAELSGWERSMRETFDELGRPDSCRFVHSVFCRISLRAGDPTRALASASEIIDPRTRNPSVRSRAYLRSLELASALLDPTWIPDSSEADSLERWRAPIEQLGTLDFITSISLELLLRASQVQDARARLSSYLTKRREVRCQSARLREVSDMLERRAD